jgi:hypothetical protein
VGHTHSDKLLLSASVPQAVMNEMTRTMLSLLAFSWLAGNIAQRLAAISGGSGSATACTTSTLML